MAAIIRLGNAAGAAGMAFVLLLGLVLQVVLNELPCPLCNLQRVGFALCGFGFLLNLRFGVRSIHYGLVLLGALFGAVAAGRQVLLHIVPGSGAYGSPILGLHYYSWAFVLFVAVIAGVAVLMILSGDRTGARPPDGPRFVGVARAAAYALVVAVLANALSTFAECGPIECPDNPTTYWLFTRPVP
jgi:disulfide bond formation protein DsbB